MQLKAESKGLNLEILWETQKPETLVTDPVRLSQILTNIVGNAVKFTESGSIRVNFGVYKDKLRIRVTDTGIGIGPEEQQRLFEPFVQADASVSRKYGGTGLGLGLGLALSKRLAQHLGGDLYLEKSESHKGSSFVIEVALFLKVSTVESPSAPAGPPSLDVETLKHKSILIVDDSPDNRVIVGRYLKALGAETLEASNGKEGVEKALNQKVDLILMDIQMPVMDGYQALAELKKRGCRSPIVALAAHAFKEERDRCLELGFSSYITKPVNRLGLQRSVSDLILRAP